MRILFVCRLDRSEFGARLAGLLRESVPGSVKVLTEAALDDGSLADTEDTSMFVLVVSDPWPPWPHLRRSLRRIGREGRQTRIHVVFALDESHFPSPFWELEFADYLRHEWRHLWHEFRPPATLTFLWASDAAEACRNILQLAGLGFTGDAAPARAASMNLSRSVVYGDSSLAFGSTDTAKELWLQSHATQEHGRGVPRTGFTVFHPRECVRNVWATLLAYAHAADAEALTEVTEHATKELTDRTQMATVERPFEITKGTTIEVVPQVPGLVFNPVRASYRWEERWHASRFRFRTNEEGNGTGSSARGCIAFYVGPVLVAEVPISLPVVDKASAERQEEPVAVHAQPFARVFVSYAHLDSVVVEALEEAYNALGMPYLRDVQELRSGDNWRQEILGLIDSAEVFQLCWSRSAKKSDEVRKEFDYAWNRHKKLLIRPCRWQKRMPEPWPELEDMHFAFLDIGRFRQTAKRRQKKARQ